MLIIDLYYRRNNFSFQVFSRKIPVLKKAAGMKEDSREPLQEKYFPIKRRFYKVLDNSDETCAYINLEILRDMVQRTNRPAITSCFNEIEASLTKIIAWQRDPWLAEPSMISRTSANTSESIIEKEEAENTFNLVINWFKDICSNLNVEFNTITPQSIKYR